MGRLFQYNRFGAMESANKRKKDTSKNAHDKAKMVSCNWSIDIYIQVYIYI